MMITNKLNNFDLVEPIYGMLGLSAVHACRVLKAVMRSSTKLALYQDFSPTKLKFQSDPSYNCFTIDV